MGSPYLLSSSIASASRGWFETGLVCRNKVLYAAKMSAFTFSSRSAKRPTVAAFMVDGEMDEQMGRWMDKEMNE